MDATVLPGRRQTAQLSQRLLLVPTLSLSLQLWFHQLITHVPWVAIGAETDGRNVYHEQDNATAHGAKYKTAKKRPVIIPQTQTRAVQLPHMCNFNFAGLGHVRFGPPNSTLGSTR